jgi:hypothetical protein
MKTVKLIGWFINYNYKRYHNIGWRTCGKQGIVETEEKIAMKIQYCTKAALVTHTCCDHEILKLKYVTKTNPIVSQ